MNNPRYILELGARRILEQGTETILPDHIQPTYNILEDYSHLLPPAKQKFIKVTDHGDLDKTLKTISQVVNKYKYQVTKIAKHLKGDNKEQSAYNIWHWFRTNFNFKEDTKGKEELRTPSRSYYDRETGIDCDDFTIMALCILVQMGYSWKEIMKYIVGFDDTPRFHHIYAVLKPDLVIDGVMNRFNKHPEFITKTKKMALEINILEGLQNIQTEYNDKWQRIPITKKSIYGLGATTVADAITTELINRQSELIKGLTGKPKEDQQNLKELRKTRSLIMLNGTDERDILLDVMPYVSDIDLQTGNFKFVNEEIAGIVTEYLDDIVDSDLVENDYFETRVEVNELGAIGLFKRKRSKKEREERKAKRKEKRKKFWKKIGGAVKKVGQSLKKGVSKVVKAVVRFNPLTIAARNSLLLLMKVNMFGYATKMYLGANPNVAKERGLSSDNVKKLQKGYLKSIKFYKSVGGKPENLMKAVNKGWRKKPIFNRRAKITLTGLGVTMDFEGYEPFRNNFESYYTIEGLGEPVTVAAALVSGGTLLAAMKGFFKGAKLQEGETKSQEMDENGEAVKKKKSFWKKAGDFIKKIVPGKKGFKDKEEEEIFTERAFEIDEFEPKPDDDKETPKWVLPTVIIGGTVLIGGIVAIAALSGKNKK